MSSIRISYRLCTPAMSALGSGGKMWTPPTWRRPWSAKPRSCGQDASSLKAADSEQLLRQYWLDKSEELLRSIQIVPLDRSAIAEFEKLHGRRNCRRSAAGTYSLPR